MQSRLRRLSWILEEAFRQWNGSEICACPNFTIGNVIEKCGGRCAKVGILECEEQVGAIWAPARITVTALVVHRVNPGRPVSFPVINVKPAPAIISTGCIENEQVESVPIKVRHHAVLEADRGEAYTRKVVEQVDRIGVAVLDIKHTDLIRLQ